MNKVITLSNPEYFDYGQLFLMTRKLINADFYLYGYGLSESQQKLLEKHNVRYQEISQNDFENKMQFLKFSLMRDHLDGSGGGISFVDFDTFFVQDWHDAVFVSDFALGITVRNSYVKQRIKRSYANGGVIFSKNCDPTVQLLDFAIETMKQGSSNILPEYNEIFRTLEENRPAHKTWNRNNLRWWVDQVFLSSLALRFFKQNGYKSIKNQSFLDFEKGRIGLFCCDLYNFVDPSLSDVRNCFAAKKCFILHMKNKGRKLIDNFEKEVQKYV